MDGMNFLRVLCVMIFASMFISPLALAATGTTPPPTQTTVGLRCGADELRNGQCVYNLYDALGIRQSTSQDPTSVGLYLQDIVLSLTFFIGTVVTIVIIVAGLMYIRSGIQGDEGMQGTAKKGIINGLIGMLIVMSSYAIIRLVQFVVRGG